MAKGQLELKSKYLASVSGVGDDLVNGPSLFTDSLAEAKRWVEATLPTWERDNPELASTGEIVEIEVEEKDGYLDFEYLEGRMLTYVAPGGEMAWHAECMDDD